MIRERYIKHRDVLAGVNYTIESPEDHIQKLINQIIQTMYIPVPDERMFVKVPDILAIVDDDAINWGDLRCVEVVTHGDGYMAIIEEADPGAHNLCAYIENLLSAWGWSVIVKANW